MSGTNIYRIFWNACNKQTGQNTVYQVHFLPTKDIQRVAGSKDECQWYPPTSVSIPACHYSRAEPRNVRKAKPHPNFADVRVSLPALEIVTLSLHCAVQLRACIPESENECKRAGREGGQIQFFSPTLELYLAQSVHVTGWLCRLQVNSLCEAEAGRAGGASVGRRAGRAGAQRCPEPALPAGHGPTLSPLGTPCPCPRAHGTASAAFSTFRKQTGCLEEETLQSF